MNDSDKNITNCFGQKRCNDSKIAPAKVEVQMLFDVIFGFVGSQYFKF